jgi:hypothetical protein
LLTLRRKKLRNTCADTMSRTTSKTGDDFMSLLCKLLGHKFSYLKTEDKIVSKSVRVCGGGARVCVRCQETHRLWMRFDGPFMVWKTINGDMLVGPNVSEKFKSLGPHPGNPPLPE